MRKFRGNRAIRSASLVGVALVISLGFSSSSARQPVGTKAPKSAPKAKHRPHWFHLGRASW